MAAREYQDLSGGYVNETTADQTAGRVFQDLSGGYIVIPAGQVPAGTNVSLMQISG